MEYLVKETSNFVIEYPNKSDFDIETVSHEIDEACIPVLNFFGISGVDKKTKAKLWGSLDDFRNLYRVVFKRDPGGWVCGFVYNGSLQTLTLDEHRKTNSHENDTLSDLLKVIVHEFAHNVHSKYTNIKKLPKWVSEGIACCLANQYENREPNSFKATLEQLKYGGCSYVDNKLMMKHVLLNNNREYVWNILTSPEFSFSETEKIYNEFKTRTVKK